MSLLYCEEYILCIKSRVLSEGPWNNNEGFCKANNTKLCLSAYFVAHVLHKVFMSSNFKGTSTGEDALVFDGVLDRTHSISNGILSLCNRVIVRSLDEDSARERVLNTFDESVFIFSENLLINFLSKSKVRFLKVVNRIELSSTASEGDSLSVSLFASADTNDAVTGKELKRRRVNSLLVDDNEVFAVFLGADGSLEVNDLLNLIVGELSLTSDELLAVLGV